MKVGTGADPLTSRPSPILFQAATPALVRSESACDLKASQAAPLAMDNSQRRTEESSTSAPPILPLAAGVDAKTTLAHDQLAAAAKSGLMERYSGDTKLLELYARKLSKPGWAGRRDRAERAYVLQLKGLQGRYVPRPPAESRFRSNRASSGGQRQQRGLDVRDRGGLAAVCKVRVPDTQPAAPPSRNRRGQTA